MKHDIISHANNLTFTGTLRTTHTMLKLLIDVYGGETTVCDMIEHITYVNECDAYACRDNECAGARAIPKTKYQIPRDYYSTTKPKTKNQIPRDGNMKVKLIRAIGERNVVRNGRVHTTHSVYEYKDINTGKEYFVSSPQEMADKGATIISQNY